MWINFTNGSDCQLLLCEQLSPKLQTVVYEADKDRADDNDGYYTVFVDMDTCRLRAVLNQYRNRQITAPGAALQYDLQRFRAAFYADKDDRIIVKISHRSFHTTRTTLCQSPYFSALFKLNPSCPDTIARDPVLFEQVLSHLRNPILHPLTELATSAPEELEFYQLGSCWSSSGDGRTIDTASSHNIDKFWPGMHQLSANGMPDLFVTMPTISYFRNGFQRFTQHQRNFLTWIPSPCDDKDEQVVFYATASDNESVNDKQSVNIIPNNAHLLEGMHLTFETLAPITCLNELFEDVEIELRCSPFIDIGMPAAFPGVNPNDFSAVAQARETWRRSNPSPTSCTTLKFKHTAEFMDAYSDLRQMPSFNVHETDRRCYITVPLRFFFCENTGIAFHLDKTVSNITVRVSGCNQENFNCKKPTTMQLCCTVFKLNEEERLHFETDTCEQLIDDSHHFLRAKLPMLKRTFRCDNCHVVRYFLFSLYDASTGERVKAALKGKLTVEDRVFCIDPYVNQMNQFRHFGGHSQQMYGAPIEPRELHTITPRRLKQVNYDPYIWLISFGTTSCVGNQPSGHEFIGAGNQFTLDLSCDRDNVIVDGWMCTYNVLVYNKDSPTQPPFVKLNINENELFFL